MTFGDWAGAGADIVQSVAIVIGGIWAYVKFVRGRVFHRRVGLETDAERFEFENQPVVRVKVKLHNEGLSRVDLGLPAQKQVLVSAAAREDWVPNTRVVWSEKPVRARLFQDHNWVEPGETIDDDLLVPIGRLPADAVALRVTALIKSPVRRWLTRSGRYAYATDGPEQRLVWTDHLVLPVDLESVEPGEFSEGNDDE